MVAPTLGLEDQKAILRYILSKNFRLFFLYGFGAAEYCRHNPQDAWVFPPFHNRYLDFLNKHFWQWRTWRMQGIRKPLKIMTEIFRGGGKSTIGNAFDLFVHINDPNTVQILSSYGMEKSREFLHVDKSFMEGKAPFGLFTDLWPGWVPENPEINWRRESITHAYRTNHTIRDPSISAASILKGIAGIRPDYIRLDDPIFAERISVEETHVMQARKHLDSNKWALKSNGLYFLDLTPYTDKDVAAKVWHEEGVASVEGQEPLFDYKKDPDGWHVFYAPVKDPEGNSVIPTIYPIERLDAMQRENPDDFAAQMLLDPASGLNNPLRRERIEHFRIPKHEAPRNLHYSIHCDTAFKSSELINKGSANVIQLWGVSEINGLYYFLRGLWSRTWSGDEFFNELANILKELWQMGRYPYIVTHDKENAGLRGSFEAQLLDWCRRFSIPCPATLGIPRSLNFKKDERIRAAVTNWRAGKVRLIRGAEGEEQLIYEMSHIGYTSMRDMADAAADLWHPEVFRAAPDGVPTDDDGPHLERPYDRELWATSGTLLDEQLRDFYDGEHHEISENARDLEDLIEGRIVQ